MAFSEPFVQWFRVKRKQRFRARLRITRRRSNAIYHDCAENDEEDTLFTAVSTRVNEEVPAVFFFSDTDENC